MNFTLNVLGTASALPTAARYPTSQVLNVRGRLFMIDCGEGAQMLIRRAGISFGKIGHICLSHIHGDHLFGLFGLLSTMTMMGRTARLTIFAPENFRPILDFYRTAFGVGMQFEIDFVPLAMDRPERVWESRNIELLAFPLNHRIETFGFIVREKNPIPKYLPRSYAYCSDTAPFPELAEWVQGVSLLYHETTFPASMEETAAKTYHSTTVQAAETALKAGVDRLITGHYSSRFPNVDFYLDEIKAIFPHAALAHDGDVFEVPLITSE